MDLRKEIRQITPALVLALCALAGTTTAQQPSVGEQLEKSRIIVHAFDKQGRLIRSGVGFIYDQDTVVCSYSNVRGASVIKVETEGARSYSNRLISYNSLFDLAALRAEEEMPVNPPLGSSDMVAAGDSLYFYTKQKRNWKVAETSVKNFIDSGNGYEIIRLKTPGEQEPLPKIEPSPLFNAAGKVVAWLNTSSSALPLEAIAGIVVDKSSSISLTEANESLGICNIKNPASMPEPKTLDAVELKTAEGHPPFSFAIDLPREWKYFRLASAGRYILRATDEEAGVCVELRILPQQSDDLQISVEKSETLFNSGLSRSGLAPFSGDAFSGFKADYVEADPDSEFAVTAYYTMSNKNFYILAMRYPEEYAEAARRLLDQIVSSLKL